MSLANYLSVIDACASRVVTDDPDVNAWIGDYSVFHRYRLAEDLQLVEELAEKNARILEFGSSPFFLSLALMERGYDLQGLDLAPTAFNTFLQDTGLPVLRINFETEPLPYPDDSFDLILFNQVFEHLRLNPIATMREVRRVLKPTGTLLLSTPNCRSLRGLWMLLRHHTTYHVAKNLYDEYDKLNSHGFMGHVREYTAREVSGFLEKIGLRTRRTIFRSYGPPVRQQASVALVAGIERVICAVAPGLRTLFMLVCEKV